jgi:tRNA-Thr(GGU) m(6)t(6)A37 methyltransferase TsaA
MNCGPIGFVKSPVKEGVNEGWGRVVSEIRLDKKLEEGLRGIADFSHIIVVFEMHKSTWNPATDLVRRPQGRSELPPVGIFAQRAKHRPNPIGITAVKLLGVEKNVLKVGGLDAPLTAALCLT